MEIISKAQEAIISQLADTLDSKEFYLTGGTALSLFYLKHRRSNDLDFFTKTEELILPFSYNLEEDLKKSGFKPTRQRGLHSFVEIIVKKEEIEIILEKGWPVEDAKIGTEGKAFVFEYNKEWEGRFYKEKEVRVYYKYIKGNLVLLTVKAKYGEGFSKEEVKTK